MSTNRAPRGRFRVIPYWRRKLTHAYSAWAIYLVIGLHFIDLYAQQIARFLPLWLSLPLLVAAIAGGLIKQRSVSGED